MIIFDRDGKLQLRKGGQAKIASKFRSFYINKLQAEATCQFPRVAKPATISAEEAIKKKPVLSAKTEYYAEKRKMKLGTDGGDVVDHLYRKAQLEQEKKLEKAEKVRQAQIDLETTFKPRTLDYPMMSSKTVTSGDKCLDLYSRVRPG